MPPSFFVSGTILGIGDMSIKIILNEFMDYRRIYQCDQVLDGLINSWMEYSGYRRHRGGSFYFHEERHLVKASYR